MNHRVRTSLPVAAMTVLLTLAAACGSDTVDTDAAGTDTPASAAGKADAPANADDAFAAFESCMRDAGVNLSVASVGGSGDGLPLGDEPQPLPDETDPQATANVDDLDREEVAAAQKECEKHLANIDNGFDGTPEQQAALDDAQLEWATCMEDQGFDVPESTPSGGGAISFESSASADPGDASQSDGPQGGISLDDIDMDEFNAANDACEYVWNAFNEANGLAGATDK